MGNCNEKDKTSKKEQRQSINPAMVSNSDQQTNLNKNNEVKVSFQGSIAVGKTRYYQETKDDISSFKDKTTEPSGANAVKHIDIPGYGKTLAVLWDTAGEETYFAVTATLIRKSNAIMLLYAIDNPKSFENLTTFWIDKIEEVLGSEATVHLIGNKVDLAMKWDDQDKPIREQTDEERIEKKFVTKAEAKKLADDKGYLWQETSALRQINLEACFVDLIKASLDKRNNA